MGVLAGGRHAHCAAPIVVQVAKLVRESLHMIRLHLGCVVDNDIMNRCHRTLSHALRHQEKVVVISPRDARIDHCTGRRVRQSVPLKIAKVVETRVTPMRHIAINRRD